MKKILFTISLFSFFSIRAQDISIIPQPVSLVAGEGKFLINEKTKIIVIGTESKAASFLNLCLKRSYGLTLPVVFQKRGFVRVDNNSIFLDYSGNNGYSKESYTLDVRKKSVLITGDDRGIFYGIQTLVQLLPVGKKHVLTMPVVKVIDSARFAYRGMHLDVGRHFFSVGFVKKFIDYIAMHKMNTFHWHLTEDQGWRIEIKKYPKLTQIGGFRNGTIIGHHPGTGNDGVRDGGFYTQEQIKEVVKYAADRYIYRDP